MPGAETRPRFRRVMRLSVGGLMLMILGLGIWLGWISNKARTQKKAVEAINARHGSVDYRHQYVAAKYQPKAEPPGPKWLRERIGDDYFQTPIMGELSRAAQRPGMARDNGKPIPILPHDDDIMASFGKLTELETLRIDRGLTTDAGLAEIEGLGRLKVLELREADDITDAGLAHLSGLARLETLEVGQANRITDAGIAHLADLKNLSSFFVMSPHLTDASLKTIGGFKKLEKLGFDRAPFTDAGLSHLAALTHLTILRIRAEQATDDGLVHLSGLKDLTTLNLTDTPITGRGLSHLRGLTRLTDLYLRSDRFTDEGLEHLADLSSLRRLHLFAPRLTNSNLDRIARAVQLNALVLYCPELNDDQLVHVASMKNLKILVLRNNGSFTDRAIENLRGLDSLTDLGIGSYKLGSSTLAGLGWETRVTEKGLEATRALPVLKRLTIGSPAFTREAVTRLRKQWPNLRISNPLTDITQEEVRDAARKKAATKKAATAPR